MNSQAEKPNVMNIIMSNILTRDIVLKQFAYVFIKHLFCSTWTMCPIRQYKSLFFTVDAYWSTANYVLITSFFIHVAQLYAKQHGLVTNYVRINLSLNYVS